MLWRLLRFSYPRKDKFKIYGLHFSPKFFLPTPYTLHTKLERLKLLYCAIIKVVAIKKNNLISIPPLLVKFLKIELHQVHTQKKTKLTYLRNFSKNCHFSKCT